MDCIKCKSPLPEGALYCPMCGKKQVQERRKALKRANGTGTVYSSRGAGNALGWRLRTK
mgnify:CR=1 FL=1